MLGNPHIGLWFERREELVVQLMTGGWHRGHGTAILVEMHTQHPRTRLAISSSKPLHSCVCSSLALLLQFMHSLQSSSQNPKPSDSDPSPWWTAKLTAQRASLKRSHNASQCKVHRQEYCSLEFQVSTSCSRLLGICGSLCGYDREAKEILLQLPDKRRLSLKALTCKSETVTLIPPSCMDEYPIK